jgi:hypothetical protein
MSTFSRFYTEPSALANIRRPVNADGEGGVLTFYGRDGLATFGLTWKEHMPNRNRHPRRLAPNPRSRNRRNVPPQDLFDYARSFHKAAKKLAEALELDSSPLTEFAGYPVVFIYRHALELYLKAIVLGAGGNFLASKPDRISIGKTHSASWLAQFVCQIVTALKWEPEFKCQGVESLDEFKAVVESVNSVDPGQFLFRIPGEIEAKGSVNVREFARTMDALLDLSDSTADALAATWDTRNESADVMDWADSTDGPVQ